MPLAVEELEDLCFDFGIEYDGDVGYVAPRPGVKLTDRTAKISKMPKPRIYLCQLNKSRLRSLPTGMYVSTRLKVELMSRYDLLCIEGLARALRVFLQKEQPPTYTLSSPAQMQEVFVEASVHSPP